MITLTNRNLGAILVAVAIVLFVLLVAIKLKFDSMAEVQCTDNNCPFHDQTSTWLVFAGLGVSALLIASGVFLLFGNRHQEENDAISLTSRGKELAPVDVSQLEEEEKQVYDVLKEKGGSLFQGDMIKETGFSKVKITRILDRLEQKNVVERKRRGMSNLVVLR